MTSSFSLSALLCLVLPTYVWGQCSFTATNANAVINLNGIKGKESVVTVGNFQYYLTPCSNDVKCDAGSISESVMAAQLKDNVCQAYLASYNANNRPTYADVNGGQFTFQYSNGQTSGQCSDPRKLTLIYECATNADGALTAAEGEKCSYTYTKKTSAACLSVTTLTPATGGGSDDDGISGGSVFIIILLVGFFLYCAVGYAWNVKRSEEQNWGAVKQNTPHLNFWCLVPKWTWAGCCVSKEWVQKKIDERRGGGGSHEPLTDEDDEA